MGALPVAIVNEAFAKEVHVREEPHRSDASEQTGLAGPSDGRARDCRLREGRRLPVARRGAGSPDDVPPVRTTARAPRPRCRGERGTRGRGRGDAPGPTARRRDRPPRARRRPHVPSTLRSGRGRRWFRNGSSPGSPPSSVASRCCSRPRPLRRDVVRGESPPHRDWDPHGPRRAPRRRRQTGVRSRGAPRRVGVAGVAGPASGRRGSSRRCSTASNHGTR